MKTLSCVGLLIILAAMEAVTQAVATTCPLAFSGGSGSIFLNAVTAVVAAHCAIFADYRWPPDKADEIIGKSTERMAYDFIVVGAGTAGSIVASSLSNTYLHSSVLLVEAGEDPGIDSEVPAFLFLNQQSNNDWSYKTEPDERSCLSFRNQSCIWSKGKGMGGSSSINAMLYIRGHAEDYNKWEESGNPGWGYNDMKYYFESQEERFNVSNLTRTAGDGWYAVIDEAWQQLGLKSYNYDNNEGITGTKKCVMLTKDGKRLNTAKIVLNQAPNLDVMKGSEVQNIILNKKLNHAVGVKIRHSSGIAIDIFANKEVILAAGSIASPQILMRSGIGIKKHLEEIGIECYLDVPVGQNLQDHLIFPLLLQTNKHTTIAPQMANLFLVEYMLMRTGPISNIGITDFFAFVNTKNSSDRPNIQFHHMYFTKNNEDMLRQYIEGIGYKKQIVEEIITLNKKHDIFGIYPTLLHPKSKGEVLLRDSNWKSNPIVKANYLLHPDDMQSFVEAIKLVQKLEKTDVFKSLDMKLLDLKISDCSTFKFNTVPYWRCYIRHMATTVYHPVGTVKMGNDSTSVVDHNLLVRGLNNLRVVDASVMPSIPGANTMATTLAVAHKAADIIINKYNNNKDEL